MARIHSPIKELYDLEIGRNNLKVEYISDLPVSQRLKNCLHRNGVFNMTQLIEKSMYTLYHSRGFGTNCLSELNEFLNTFASYQNDISNLKKHLNYYDANIIRSSQENENKDTQEEIYDICFYEIYNLNPNSFDDLIINDIMFSTRLSNAIRILNIKTIGELLRFNPEKFSRLQGVGKNTIEELNKYLENISLESNDNLKKTQNLEILEKFVSKYSDVDISPWLKEFDKVRKTKLCSCDECVSVKDYISKYIESERSTLILISFINWFEMDLTSTFDEYVDSMPERWKGIIKLRENGKTLEECGKYYKLTRERVRQIEKKLANRWLIGLQ